MKKCFSIIKLVVTGFVIISVLNSCGIQRRTEYLQLQDSKNAEFLNSGLQDYKLKPKDELYIQISSLDDAVSTITSSSNSFRMDGGISPYSASLVAYTIDKDGFVELPVIGKIQVQNKTIPDVVALIKLALEKILNQPVVSVKLVNKYISVLGEVRLPGRFIYSESKITIFDALGMAGDITEFGNKKKVILVRNENEKNIRSEINLLKSDILASNYYYLRPGDIIYVLPRRGKYWGFKEFPFATLLTAITTAVVVLQYQQSIK